MAKALVYTNMTHAMSGLTIDITCTCRQCIVQGLQEDPGGRSTVAAGR